MRLKWTLEKIKEEALKYKTRSEFAKYNNSAYNAAKRMGIFENICAHMPKRTVRTGTKHHNFKWSFENLQAEALKYKDKKDFRDHNHSAYQIACRKKWLDNICSHMPKHLDTSGNNNSLFKWTLEALTEEALKYSNRYEFSKKSSGAYWSALHRNLLDIICGHMKILTGLSSQERSILVAIRQKYPAAKKLRDRNVKIEGKSYIQGFEIDIYIPELNKGIEFDGTYYHSLKGLRRGRNNWPLKDLKKYHKIKDEYFKSKNISILHIKEKDWLKNSDECMNKCFKFLSNEVI